MTKLSCKTCLYCVRIKTPEGKPNRETGICHGAPPLFVSPQMTAFPPVSLKTGWCGMHKAA